MKKTWILIGLLLLLLPVSSAMAWCGHNDFNAPGDAGIKYTYEQSTSTHHERIVHMKFVCQTCGDSRWERWSSDPYPHEFSGNKCTLCNYTRSGSSTPTPRPTTPATCSHTNHRSVPFGEPDYVNINDPSEHRIERHYQLICTSCNKVIESDYIGKTTAAHSFNSLGTCTKCGYSRGGARVTATPKPTQSAPATPKPTKAPSVSATLSGSGNTRSIHVTSNGKWTAYTNSTWVTINKTSGVSGETIQVTLDVNPSATSSRNGFVHIMCGTAKKTVMIKQEANQNSAVINPGVSIAHTNFEECGWVSQRSLIGVYPYGGTAPYKVAIHILKENKYIFSRMFTIEPPEVGFGFWPWVTLSAGTYSVQYNIIDANGVEAVGEAGNFVVLPSERKLVKTGVNIGSYEVSIYDNNECKITRYYGRESIWEVPATLNYNGKTYNVTEIAASACYNNDKLVMAYIADGIQKIDTSAFGNCDNLVYVEIPDSLYSVGSNAFAGCKALTKVQFGDGTYEIADNAFDRCDNMVIYLPYDATYIINLYADQHNIECVRHH